ncbi:hypothetical protein pneo_cds_305 [Pandoravirus neocaledonia]|uniref:Uncharacterized protein n=1 Tax=Pandoravirus neocaledonia TaxID=2107708 RepID=A0A2U7UBZ4_9VIRU|nr:hypothetical protein pneo_cds_305 [Pandoravirus neocaledonia]AVK75912.1 hypothetical protein pneo_cds_305 [Pandoravirus neocaledonia]
MSDLVGRIVDVDGCDALVLEGRNNRAIYVPRVANLYDPLAVNTRTLDHLRRCSWRGDRVDDAVRSDIRQFAEQELEDSVPTATGAPVAQGAASLPHLTGATSWQVIPYTDGTLSSDMRNRPTINGKPKGPRRPVVQLSGADANGRAIYVEITKIDNGNGVSVHLPRGSAFR